MLGEILQYAWALFLAYAGWLHSQLHKLSADNSDLAKALYDFKADANAKYATLETVREVEGRLMAFLVRIDDKVTRILEDKK